MKIKNTIKTLIKWLRILHRDIGYAAVGLTIIFSVSGIAVNHVHDWNPNYSIEQSSVKVLPVESRTRDGILAEVLPRLNLAKDDIRNAFRPNPDNIEIYLEDGTIFINLISGVGRKESFSKRSIIYDFNFLHLNSGNDFWKWFSDLFAFSLIFLAISGLFIVKGKKGFKWRGLILTLLGLLIPVFFIIYYRLVSL